MADKLFPVIDLPAIIGSDEAYDKRYKRSYRWDMEKGDFVRDGANRIPECDGYEAYKVWCMKTAETERNTCIAYPSQIGTEMIAAFKKPSQRAQESAIERTIKEALMVNPRTEYVRGFSFTWKSDSVMVTFYVKGINQEGFKVEI